MGRPALVASDMNMGPQPADQLRGLPDDPATLMTWLCGDLQFTGGMVILFPLPGFVMSLTATAGR